MVLYRHIPDLGAHYNSFYQSDVLRAWRALGAIDKAHNVIQSWNRAGIHPSPSVIDIGCGDGAIALELAAHRFCRRYHGVDISESGILAARDRFVHDDYSFSTYDGDILPFPDSSFDLAILSHVLEHVSDPRGLLAEAARAAKYVFVEVPLELNSRTAHNFEWTDTGHINLYNTTSLRHLVQSTRLHVLVESTTCPSVETHRFHGSTVRSTLRWWIKATALRMSPALARSRFTYHGVVLAAAEPGLEQDLPAAAPPLSR